MGNKPFKDEGKLSQAEDANVFQRLLNKQDGNMKEGKHKVQNLEENKNIETNEDAVGAQMENDKEEQSEYMDNMINNISHENGIKYTLVNQVEDDEDNEGQLEEVIDTDVEDNEETKNENSTDKDIEDDKCEETLHEYNKRKCRNYWRLIEIQEESESDFEQIYESENQAKCFQQIDNEVEEKEECFKEGEEFAFLTPKSSDDGSSNSLSNNQNKLKKLIEIPQRKENLQTDYEDNSESNFLVINIEVNDREDEVDFAECQYAGKHKSNKSTFHPSDNASDYPIDSATLGVFSTAVTNEDNNKGEDFEMNNPENSSKNVRIYKNDGPITEICRAKTTLYENLSDDAKDALTTLEANYNLVESDKAALAFLTTIDADDSTKGIIIEAQI